jgi:hypothetical protein
MRRVLTCGVVLVCLAALFALVRAEGERTLVADGESAVSSPVPVAVSNFPPEVAVRATRTVNVTGSVAVTNFPATQTVGGTVQVGNLPIDAEGNVRVAGALATARPIPHFAGLTGALFAEGTAILTLSHACNAEIAGTRLCEQQEVLLAIPPPLIPGRAVLIMYTESGTQIGGRLRSSCMSSGGELFDCGIGPFPAACCGF